jgi:hypothetical protein
VSSLLPFPVSVATISSSVNHFPVPSGSPSCLDPIFIRCFHSRVAHSRLSISLLFSSARSGLGRSCFLFACGTSLVSDSRRKQQHEFPRAPRQGPFPQIFPPAAASGGQRSFSCQKWFPLWILSPCRDLVLAAVLRSIFFWPRDFGLA